MSKKVFSASIAVTAILGLSDGYEAYAIIAIGIIAVTHSIVQGILDKEKKVE